MNIEQDLRLALNVRENAKPGTCNYSVGSVLKTKNGKRYTGCNIDNDAIQSMCAERVAFAKAISEGESEFEYILVVGGPKGGNIEKCLPCGYCRPFMNQYVGDDFKVYTYYDEKVEEYTMKDLLPHSFKLK